MHMQDIAKTYEEKTDEELLQLATKSEQLTAEAHAALNCELAKRRIDSAVHLKLAEESERGKIEQPMAHAPLVLGDSQSVGEFIAEVHRIYYDHFWLCVKLAAPSVIVTPIALLVGRNEAREIAQHFIFSPEMQRGILEIWLVKIAQVFFIWMAVAFSFAGVCVAVSQVASGVVPSVSDVLRRNSRTDWSILAHFPVALRLASGCICSHFLVDPLQSPGIACVSRSSERFHPNHRRCVLGLSFTRFFTVCSRHPCRHLGQLQSRPSNVPQ